MNNPSGISTLTVIADDLTGAADCAARGYSAGLHAVIHIPSTPPQTAAEAAPISPRAPELHAYSSHSRHLDPTSAGNAVSHLLGQINAINVCKIESIIYNKIDSTLRGNIGSEVDSILSRFTPIAQLQPCAVVCPAFPDQDRGLLDGRLVFAAQRGQDAPDLVAQLRTQSPGAIAHIPLPHVRRGQDALAQTIRNLRDQQHARMIVVDAMENRDLDIIVDAIYDLPAILPVGSAGMVEPLARRLAAGQPHEPVARSTPQASLPRGAIWYVVGSGSETARRQIAAAHAAGIPAYDVTSQTPDWTQDALLLQLPAPAPQAQLEGAHAHSLAARLAQTVVLGLDVRDPAVLILVGGDTAQMTLSALEVVELEVLAEVQPGMPLTKPRRQSAPQCSAQSQDTGDRLPPHIILKAGNHGTDATLVELLEWVRARQADDAATA